MTISAADLFISYKAEDRPRLAALVAALEAEGLTVWWDARLSGGAHWRQEIQDQLDAAGCVLVAWSTRSVGPDGHFVRDEATRALRNGTYLPIRLDTVDPPLGFGEVQALDLRGWSGDRADPRLAGLVNTIKARLAGGPSPPNPAPPPRPQVRLSRRIALAGGVGAVAVAGAGGWFWFRPGSAESARIAVLPFANLSNDPEQAYFSDGVAEELRSALSRIGMEVIGRASSVAVDGLDTKVAAAKLNVAHLLTGSVRRSPSMIRITAQLVSGTDGVEIWSQSYDRTPGDAIRIQTDIAASVAQSLSIALGRAGRAALILGRTTDSLAQDLLLRGRERWVTSDSEQKYYQALRLTDAAIARDSGYADAYVQRAQVLTSIAENYPADAVKAAKQLADAETAARRAIAIAPRLGSPHVALARIAYNRLDIAGLLRETEQALLLSPDDPNVLLDTATTMATLGRGEEGLRIAQRLIALDGLNARAYARMSLVMFLLRRYPGAIEAVRRANAIAPGNPARNATAGDSWLMLGRPDKAKAEYAKMPGDDYLRLTGEGVAAARVNDRRGAERALAQLRAAYGDSTQYQYAVIYAQLGDTDRAFAALDKALALKDPGLVGLRTDAFLDSLRADPRFARLIARLRFP